MSKARARADHVIESDLKPARYPASNLMRSEMLIVGAGAGLGASLARAFAAEGARVALAASNIAKLSDLCHETRATALVCNASSKDKEIARFLGSNGVPGRHDL